ncbi:MAG TPA: acyl carrier protein [Acidimicrobiales bacterium]|nr:acyl carrier protein [Acidimicrobiales bacterium]
MTTTEARALLEQLLQRIAPELDLSEVEPDTPLQDTFDLDSMDFLQLITDLHERTGIDVPERDYPKLGTIDGFVRYLVAAAPALTVSRSPDEPARRP